MKLRLMHSVGASAGALLTSTATLVCCVLPAIFVVLGAGASLAGLVSAFPQLVWMSAHKGWVFGGAGALLLASGVLLMHTRQLPCPVDANAARICQRLRRLSQVLFIAAAVLYLVGLIFAFVLPRFDFVS